MLGPTIIARHETSPKQMAMKDSRGRVLPDVPTVNTWATHNIFVSITDEKDKVANLGRGYHFV
jgi:hypothetical protein